MSGSCNAMFAVARNSVIPPVRAVSAENRLHNREGPPGRPGQYSPQDRRMVFAGISGQP